MDKMEDKAEIGNVSASDIEEDNIVTMVDVLEQEAIEEADAKAVLGGVDDKNCTYAKGYIARQPLYACKTCIKDEPRGICLACSYRCHEGHDLVELYTKRNFRCDCGTKAFPGTNCVLDPLKFDENTENSYNQNFKGVYCTCSRPYPDPDDDVEDTMLQCVVCEDWFHTRHLESKSSAPQEFEELICHICMEKLPFLRGYLSTIATTAALEDNSEINVETVNGETENKEPEASASTDKKKENSLCKLPPVEEAAKEAAYWPSGWRAHLCQCSSCVELFYKNKITFLLDENDSVQAYEKQNLESSVRETQYERGMRALNSLDRVKQMEAIQSYNEMKSALMEHLTKFKESRKVVSEEDIRDFFEQMKAKRPRLEIPANCH